MSIERINVLEKSIIRLEGTMEMLSTEMCKVADSMEVIATAVTKLAVVDSKLTNLTSYVARLDSLHCELSDKVDTLDTEHTSRHIAFIDKADANGWKRFSLGVGSLTALIAATFGYLYSDVHSEHTEHSAVVSSLHVIELKVESLAANSTGRFTIIEEKLKNANGHRFYIKEELKALQKTVGIDNDE